MRVVYYGRSLSHAGTGPQNGNHKYIDRIRIGDKFRYFYSQAELAAYNAGQNVNNAITGVNNYFKGKAAIKKQSKLRNPNEKNIILARQGQTSNKFGRGVAIARRTVRNGVAPIVKTANAIGNKVGETVSSVQKAYKDFNTQQKFKKAEKVHALLRNPNDNNIVLARQGKTSNPLNYKKAVEARRRRNLTTVVGNSAPKSTTKKEGPIVIKNPPKPSTSNVKPKSYKTDDKPVLVDPKESNKKSSQTKDAITVFNPPKASTSNSTPKKTDDKPVLANPKNSTKKSTQTKDSITIFDPPKSSTTNTKPKTSSSAKPILTDSTHKVKNKSEALKSYTSYYEKLFIKEGADPRDAKRWAKAAAQKRLKEET